jgi:hypothetical protein
VARRLPPCAVGTARVHRLREQRLSAQPSAVDEIRGWASRVAVAHGPLARHLPRTGNPPDRLGSLVAGRAPGVQASRTSSAGGSGLASQLRHASASATMAADVRELRLRWRQRLLGPPPLGEIEYERDGLRPRLIERRASDHAVRAGCPPVLARRPCTSWTRSARLDGVPLMVSEAPDLTCIVSGTPLPGLNSKIDRPRRRHLVGPDGCAAG